MMINSSEFTDLNRSYYEQLLKAGVPHHRAFQAASSLKEQELMLIQEIWSGWNPIIQN